MTAEKQARDLLERLGVEDAQSYTAGDLVEIANLIDENKRLRDAKDLTFFCPTCGYIHPANRNLAGHLPQASQDDEDERRWRHACAIAYCDELGYACDRVSTRPM